MADRPRSRGHGSDQHQARQDSTLAMLLAAQARGWELSYLELRDLWLRDGDSWGRAARVAVRDDPRDWFTLGERRVERLAAYDVILMRKDPPFDTEYIYSTYILERAEVQGARVFNRPQGLRDMNEKVFTAWFADCCAPTLISRDMADMTAFLGEHGKIVVKPLHGMGGRSIFVLERGDKNTNVVFETLTDYGQRYAIAQRYLPEIVTQGDARVLLIDGEPVPYALARIPAPADNRGHLAAGARAKGACDGARSLALEPHRAGHRRARHGVRRADVIGEFVTEINVNSPTGIRELDKEFKLDIGGLLIDAIARRLESR
jgi:glutathione synthase